MLSPPPMGESDSSDGIDMDHQQTPPPRNHLPLGHTSVKSLSSKFSQPQTQHSNGNHEHEELASSSTIIQEQKRIIENLRTQLTSKDRRIQQLEDQVKLLSLPLKSSDSSSTA